MPDESPRVDDGFPMPGSDIFRIDLTYVGLVKAGFAMLTGPTVAALSYNKFLDPGPPIEFIMKPTLGGKGFVTSVSALIVVATATFGFSSTFGIMASSSGLDSFTSSLDFSTDSSTTLGTTCCTATLVGSSSVLAGGFGIVKPVSIYLRRGAVVFLAKEGPPSSPLRAFMVKDAFFYFTGSGGGGRISGF
jgi:hypothetical protein